MTARKLYATPAEAFAARTEVQGDCLIWTGATRHGGYGQLKVDGRKIAAHRYAFERENGPIPEGMVLDHICHNRACCAVSHLRLATSAQNAQNRSGPTRGTSFPRGVTRHGSGYQVQVRHRGTLRTIGTFSTIEEASTAASKARLELFGAFAGNA